MARNPSPTLRRREVAARLRELRRQADLTIDEIAGRLMVSATKVSRLETGARPASLRDIRDLCSLYGVDDAERKHLMTLARQSHEPSWWQQFDLPYSNFIGLEADAAAISDYKSAIIPGLLQTEAYCRALLQAIVPKLEPKALEHRLEARVARQRLLGESVRFLFILDEAVLHRVVGGSQVMHDQLRKVIDLAGRDNVELRVLPFVVGAHPAVESNFSILEFDEKVPDVVYVEGLAGNLYLESPSDLDRYRNVLKKLLSVSLTSAASDGMLRAFLDRYAP